LDDLVVRHLIVGGIPIAAVLSGTAYLNAWTGGSALQEIVEIIEYINSLGIINIHAGAILALRASQLATDLEFSSGIPQADLAREVAQRSILPRR
jgi:hypothetical protein